MSDVLKEWPDFLEGAWTSPNPLPDPLLDDA